MKSTAYPRRATKLAGLLLCPMISGQASRLPLPMHCAVSPTQGNHEIWMKNKRMSNLPAKRGADEFRSYGVQGYCKDLQSLGLDAS